PQPDSRAAWPRMLEAAMPVASSAALAASACLRTNCSVWLRRLPSAPRLSWAPWMLRAPADGLDAPSIWRPKDSSPMSLRGLSGRLAAPPSWRSSCLAISSLRPPGRPVIWLANCVSSMLLPMSVPALSSMPVLMVEARMLLTSSCMNRPSSCLAVSLMLDCASRPEAGLRRSSDRRSMLRPLLFTGGGRVMSDRRRLGLQRAGSLAGLDDGRQILRVGAQGIEGFDDIGQLRAGGHLDERAGLLVDADVGLFGDHGLALRHRRGLADDRGRADGDRQVAMGHGARADGDGLVQHDRSCAGIDDDAGRRLGQRDFEVLQVGHEGHPLARLLRQADDDGAAAGGLRGAGAL